MDRHREWDGVAGGGWAGCHTPFKGWDRPRSTGAPEVCLFFDGGGFAILWAWGGGRGQGEGTSMAQRVSATGPGIHWKGGRYPPFSSRRPAYAQPLSP